MYITEIFLQGFRNLSQLHIEPSEGINVIYGSNAQGKTNFLESLYFCAMGRSMRGKSDQQLIAFDAQESHIRLLVQTQNRRDKIDVHLKQMKKRALPLMVCPSSVWGSCSARFMLLFFLRRFISGKGCSDGAPPLSGYGALPAEQGLLLRFAAVLSDSEAAE